MARVLGWLAVSAVVLLVVAGWRATFDRRSSERPLAALATAVPTQAPADWYDIQGYTVRITCGQFGCMVPAGVDVSRLVDCTREGGPLANGPFTRDDPGVWRCRPGT